MKFIFRSFVNVLILFLLLVSCNKNENVVEDGEFNPEDFKATTLKITRSSTGYNVEYKLENLKEKPYKKSYGYQVVVWMGDANNPYTSGNQFTIPDISAKGSIQGIERIGSEPYANPKVTYQISLDP